MRIAQPTPCKKSNSVCSKQTILSKTVWSQKYLLNS